MRLPWTLSRYISKHFFLSVMLALFGLLAITLLVDLVELIRRTAGRDGIPFHVILTLVLLKTPNFAIKLIPYAVLIGSMLALTKLTRTQELVIARSAGVSVWQFLSPAMIVVFLLGIFVTGLFNPLSAALMMRSEQVEGKYISGNASLLSFSSSGLWLRQFENNSETIGEHIIHAAKLQQNDMSFAKVMVLAFNKKGKFVERLDAGQAVLKDNLLHLSEVTRSVPGNPPEILQDYNLPTTLTIEHIQDSFASPETISFWRLPSFIDMLESAGFSALKHKLYWHSLLSNPFLMIGTVLIAAIFSLRLPRRGKVGILIVTGIVVGFIMHFCTDIIFAFGAAGTIPILLAAWTPALVTMMIGISLLLHLEDG